MHEGLLYFSVFLSNLFYKFSSFTHCVCLVHLIHKPLGNNSVTACFRAIAIILSDKTMTLEVGGGRMRVIDAPIENL